MVNNSLPEFADSIPLARDRELAIAFTPERFRSAFAALMALDAMLGRIIARANEPVLAQVGLAWWREQLGLEPEMRPRGEPVLAAVGQSWPHREQPLIELVNAFEWLIGDEQLDTDAIARFGEGRATAFAGFADLAGAEASRDQAMAAGLRWALADLAARTSNNVERELTYSLAAEAEPVDRLPPSLRGIAVLGALADRAISRREPLLTGRGAALTAWRVGMFGR